VAIDSNGEPRAIPTLKVNTQTEKDLWEIGKQIKEKAILRVRSSK